MLRRPTRASKRRIRSSTDASARPRLQRITRVSARALAALAPLAIFSAHAGDLLDAYHIAQQQDSTLQSALHQRDASVEARPQALAALLPQLGSTAQLSRSRINVLESGTSSSSQLADLLQKYPNLSRFIDYTPTPTTGSEFQNADSWSVNLSQTVFNWQYFENLSKASRQVAQAQAIFRASEQDLIYRVADTYLSVLNAQDTLRADTDARAAYKRQLDEAQKKFQVGLVAITDVRNAQASYDSADATVIVDQRALDSAKRSLGQIVGVPVPSATTAVLGGDVPTLKILQPGSTPAVKGLQEEIPLLPPSPNAEDEWVNSAMSDNPTLLSYKYAEQAAQKSISIARSQWYPSLAIVGSVSRAQTDGDSLSGSNIDTDRVTDSIGLQLNWKFFQGGSVGSQVRQAKASYLQSQSQSEGQRRVIDQSTRDAYEGVITGIASVNASHQAVISNQTSLEATQVGLKVGTRTEVDVLNAQQALAAAQRTYYKSRYDYLRSVLALKQAAGHLDESDLGQIDGLLNAQ